MREKAQRQRGTEAGMVPPLPCPFCGSEDTDKAADFGTSVMVRLLFCRACRSHFEAIKWGDTATELDVPTFLDRRAMS